MVSKYAFVDDKLERSTGKKCVCYLHELKTETGKRIVPMNQTAYDAAINILKTCSKKDGTLFVSTKSGEVLHSRSVEKNIKVIAEKAGICHFGVHVLRHTFGSNLSNSGVPDREIADLLRHAYTTVT